MLELIERQLGAIHAELAALRAEVAAVREMVATRTPPPAPANYPLMTNAMWQCAGCGTWTPHGQFHTCQTLPYNPGRITCTDGNPTL